MVYRDRSEAGRQLAAALTKYADQPNVLVLALPRGGVPVGYEVSRALHAPLDLLLVRKLGFPGNEELAMGAVAQGGEPVFNQDVITMVDLPQGVIDAVLARERQELARRERVYRDDAPPPPIADHTVILVDDGLATGATMRAAVRAARAQHAGRVVVAVPVSAETTCGELSDEVDEMVCLDTPEPFYAVGMWYQDFPQLTDEDVRNLLRRAHEEEHGARPPPHGNNERRGTPRGGSK
jgi:putative phosphoribosyl transferase